MSPGPGGRGTPPTPKSTRSTVAARWFVIVFFVLTFNVLITSLLGPNPNAARVRVPYSPTFLEQLRAGNVAAVATEGSTIEGRFKAKVTYPADQEATNIFSTEVPTFADTEELTALLRSKRVTVNATPVETGRSTLASILVSFLPTLLILGLLVWFMRRAVGQAGGAMGFAKSKARLVEPSEQRIAFKDVAGVEEAKAELAQIVDFLRRPERYRKLGGRIPRGILLTGPPGTGKTLLARAMAGEAEVPFFSIAASEFIELYVGVGASRVRDLFAQAKAAAPAIIFIDELDAIGRARGPGGMNGGHEEREQTLNQILTEMDGFDPSIGVIVLSATNRPEILDRALLRPGRFDRRVALEPPDAVGREAILRVHTRSIPLANDVELAQVAARTPGMVGADLANLVNEAALIAARDDASAVGTAHIEAALDRLILGSERKLLLTDADRRRTAYHEGGHALVGLLTPGADPVRKVSIIPHGKTLGVTLSAPAADRFSYDETYLTAKLDVLLAGRVAEELSQESVSTGAENDLRQATELARHMVGSWGMSEQLGPMVALTDPDQAIAFPATSATADATHRIVDREVQRLLMEAQGRARVLLRNHRDALDALASALVERETLEDEAIRRAVSLPAA